MKKKSAKSILASIRALLSAADVEDKPVAIRAPISTLPRGVKLTNAAHSLILNGGVDMSDPSRPVLNFNSIKISKQHGVTHVGLFFNGEELASLETHSIDFNMGDTLDITGLRITMDLKLEQN